MVVRLRITTLSSQMTFKSNFLVPSRIRVTNFYEIYLFLASYIVSWNRNAFSHWPIGVIVVFIIQLHKVEYKNARIEYKYPPILYGYLESWLFGYLDSWLFCTVKRPCLTSRLSALRFSIRFAFLALWEMSTETWQEKEPLPLWTFKKKKTLHCDSYLRTK